LTNPLRTVLFVPGNRPDRIEKALASAADAVIIDLEDAVPIAQKEKVRLPVREILDKNPSKRTYVRVNGLRTPYCKDDIEAVLSPNLSGIFLPKVESPADSFEIDRLLNELKAGDIDLIAICESAKGVEEIYSTVSAKTTSYRFSTVAFGAADYTLDLGIELTKKGRALDYPRSRIPVACRAAGIAAPLDTPWMIDIQDINGLIEDAKKAKAFGFQGKLIIHPNHIDVCNEIFSPTEQEISFAREVIEAFEEAEREGKAAISLSDKFIDYPIVEKARRVLSMIDLIKKE